MIQVFRRGADGKWTSTGTLASPLAPGAAFGAAIALSSNALLVGAPAAPSGGSVIAFPRTAPATFGSPSTLSPTGISADALFGTAISIDANRAVVGAPGDQEKGTAFVFARGADGSWTQEGSAVTARRLSDNAQFGAAVLVRGDRFFVGAPGSVFAAAVAAPPAPPPGGRGIAGGGGGGGGGRGRGGFTGGMGMVVEYSRAATLPARGSRATRRRPTTSRRRRASAPRSRSPATRCSSAPRWPTAPDASTRSSAIAPARSPG
jgi:hypothetical protein